MLSKEEKIQGVSQFRGTHILRVITSETPVPRLKPTEHNPN